MPFHRTGRSIILNPKGVSSFQGRIVSGREGFVRKEMYCREFGSLGINTSGPFSGPAEVLLPVFFRFYCRDAVVCTDSVVTLCSQGTLFPSREKVGTSLGFRENMKRFRWGRRVHTPNGFVPQRTT